MSSNLATIDANGQAAVAAMANGIGGTYAVTARVAGATDVALTLTNLAPTIALAPPAGTNLVGQARTITATIVNQDGRPLAGLPVTFQVTAGPNAGTTGTTDPANGQTNANGQITFTYVGSSGAGTDTIVASAAIPGGATITSTPVTEVWTSFPAPPPTVVNLQRFGYHFRPTSIVLTFSEPMDPSRAEALGNYTLVAPGHGHSRVIPLKAAKYNGTAQTVTLFPSQLLNLHLVYQITVNGMAPLGLTNTSGVLLDGRGNGQPGTNFVAILPPPRLPDHGQRHGAAGPDEHLGRPARRPGEWPARHQLRGDPAEVRARQAGGAVQQAHPRPTRRQTAFVSVDEGVDPTVVSPAAIWIKHPELG